FRALADRHQPAGNHSPEHFRLPSQRRDRAMKIASLALAAALVGGSIAALAQDARPGVTPSRVQPVDRIVAVVNDEVITSNELADKVGLITRQLQRQGGQLPANDVLTQQILERMVNDLLQAQLAKETGIKVDDATLDKTIDRIAQENNLSRSEDRKSTRL